MEGESLWVERGCQIRGASHGIWKTDPDSSCPERRPWGLAGFQGSELGSLLEHLNLGSVLGSSLLQI